MLLQKTLQRFLSVIRRSLVPLLFSLTSATAIAQDYSSNKLNVDLDLGFGAYYQFTTLARTDFNPVIIPDLLPRRSDNMLLRSTWNLDNDLVTDNPFFHGSYFFRFGGQFSYDSTLHVTAAVNMEQRGFSDGRFSSNTLNVYPYLNVWYKKKRGKFSHMLQVGDFWDMKLYEGLTFYNLQTQAGIFKLKYGQFFLKYMAIADLKVGIGLGIDDVYDYSFGFEKLKVSSENLSADVSIGYSNTTSGFGPGFWNFSTRFNYKGRLESYSQYSMQEAGGAFLIGLDLSENTVSKFTYAVSIDYRRYSSGFNLGYISNVLYRNPSEPSNFTNSTWESFIPLEFYERPFGQWALFTEYQSRNVQGFNVRGELSYNLFEKAYVQTKLDFNWISTNEESTVYPFYSIGIGSKPAKDIEIMLELTNRVLNLDKHYPTLYASKSPYFMIRGYKRLSFLEGNDRQHRE